jgi:hypothetical protein
MFTGKIKITGLLDAIPITGEILDSTLYLNIKVKMIMTVFLKPKLITSDRLMKKLCKQETLKLSKSSAQQAMGKQLYTYRKKCH